MALSDAPPGGGGGDDRRGRGSRVSQRVLVVEDDERVGDALVQLLRHYGHEPRLARTVVEAVRQLEAWRPHVMFLDLMLPDGSGVSVLRHVRHGGFHCRVGILTAAADARVLRAVEVLRPDRVFPKPAEFLELKAWLDAPPGGGGGGGDPPLLTV